MKYEDKTFKDGDTLMVHPQDGSEPYPVDIKTLVMENITVSFSEDNEKPDYITWDDTHIDWSKEKICWGEEDYNNPDKILKRDIEADKNVS